MNKNRMNNVNKKMVNGKLAGVLRVGVRELGKRGMKKQPGIDGILVTVGLCIIALVLCVVMKDSMTSFIQTIVNSLTSEAQKILTGVAGGVIL